VKHHVVLADDVASIRAVVRATLETDGLDTAPVS
jgi:hypothetical protein